MKHFKYAICISGEVRTAVETFPVFKSFFEGMDYDVFIHTWTTTDMKNIDNKLIAVIPETTEKISKITELYQPKKIIVQPKRKQGKYDSFASMFYSIMMANNLRLEYEIENDVEYDCVIKFRFDVIFPREIKFPRMGFNKRTMYYLFGNQGLCNEDCGAHGISDIIFWGDPLIMTILSDSYRYYSHVLIPHLIRSTNDIYFHFDSNISLYSPGQIIYKVAVDHNIKPEEVRLNDRIIPHTLWRVNNNDLDPFLDYNKIRELYYGSGVTIEEPVITEEKKKQVRRLI